MSNNCEVIGTLGPVLFVEGQGADGCKKIEPIRDTVCRALSQFPLGANGVGGVDEYIGADCLRHKLPVGGGGGGSLDINVSSPQGTIDVIQFATILASNTYTLTLDVNACKLFQGIAGGAIVNVVGKDVTGCPVTENASSFITTRQTPLTTSNTSTVTLVSSGTAGHTLSANVKVSATAGNIISINADGIYASGGGGGTTLTAVDSGTIDFTTSGTLGHTLTGVVKLDPAAGNLLTSNANGLRLDCTSITTCQTPITAVNTNSITLTANGTVNHTLQADVKISATVGNAVSLNVDGLYVSSPSLTANDSTSIDFTTSGTLNHTLTGAVKVSASPGNTIIINADGLYASGVAETSLTVNDSNSIDFTASGTANHTLTAAVKVSASVGNSVTTNADGIYVASPSLVATDSSTIDFTTSGTLGHNLTGSVIISPTPGNILVANANGLYVSGSGFSETPLTVVDSTTFDFTASGISNHTLTGSVKISTTAGNILTSDGTGLYVPTTGFSETSLTVVDTSTIDFTASGTSNHTLTGSVRVSTTAGNSITVNADGLYVSSPSFTANDSATIDFTTSGTLGHTLTGVVKLDPAAGNLLVANANGLRLDCTAIDNCQANISVVDTASVNLTSSGSHGHTIQADVIVSPNVGNQLSILANGLYVAASAAANVCASLALLPSNGTAVVGSTLLVGADCKTYTLPNTASGNVSHDATLTGDGTVGSPLAVVPCQVIAGIANNSNTLTAGDLVVVKGAAGACEVKSFAGGGGSIVLDPVCNSLTTSASGLKAKPYSFDAGSTYTPGTTRALRVKNTPSSAGTVISNTISLTITNTHCLARIYQITVDFGAIGAQIPIGPSNNMGATFNVAFNVGTFTDVGIFSTEGQDAAGGGASDLQYPGQSITFVVTVPAGGTYFVGARVTYNGSTTATVSACEDPVISYVGGVA